MTWLPWVSRGRYDDMREQRDRLIMANGKLMDHVMRIDRTEHGLTEKPVEKRTLKRIPESVTNLIAGFSNTTIQSSMTMEAKKQHAAGKPWPEIEEFLKREMGVA
jgi:hypothetical protein